MTRPLGPVLAAMLVAASAVSCKADRSKPRLEAADAAVSAAGKSPIAAGGAGAASSPGDAGAAAAPGEGKASPSTPGGGSDPAEDAGARTKPPAEPENQPPAEPKTQPPAQPDKKPRDDGDSRPANLKVLPKTWSMAQVNDFMKKQVSRGLGVKCNHCHDKGDFAADGSRHKEQARAMIQMTGEMNRRFFNGKHELLCFTCHKGSAEPASK